MENAKRSITGLYQETDLVKNLHDNNSYAKNMIRDQENFDCCLNKRTVSRATPQQRLAEFLRLMETEMLPLKIMLNEITIQYAKLQSSWEKKNRHSTAYENIVKIQTNLSENNLYSNRVVYSVVFNE